MSEAWLESLDPEGRRSQGISWDVTAPDRDRPELYRWRRAVGPVRYVQRPVDSGDSDHPSLTVAAWNARTGGGSLNAFWQYLRKAQPTPGSPLVVLLQEVFSGGPGIPKLSGDVAWAPRIADCPEDEPRTEIASFARDEGLSLLYVPSMRNGGDGDPPEDRGNAIVANVPLAAPRAIELPFERQRRVAVAANTRIAGTKVAFCSVHLDNRAPWRKAWRSLGRARARQMAALLPVHANRRKEDATVLGGDFNTWVRGRRERAYALARRAFPQPRTVDQTPTHHFEIGGWLRHSDHLLFDLPHGWRGSVRRADQTFGSDHYPLIGTIARPKRQGRASHG